MLDNVIEATVRLLGIAEKRPDIDFLGLRDNELLAINTVGNGLHASGVSVEPISAMLYVKDFPTPYATPTCPPCPHTHLKSARKFHAGSRVLKTAEIGQGWRLETPHHERG